MMNTAICYFLSYLVESVILWLYASNLFAAKRPVKERLTVLGCVYFILFVISLFECRWLNAILFLLLNFCYLAVQFCLKWYSALFHSAIITTIMALCELMVYGIISLFSPHFFSKSSYFYNLAILTIFSKIIYFTIIYLLIHSLKEHYDRQQQDKSILILIFMPVTSLFVMITFVRIGETVTVPPSLDWMVILSAILLLVINLLVFGINHYNQKKSIEFTEMQLLLQKESDAAEYYKMLSIQNENQRILIHDIKKHLQSINLLNNQKENNKINAYIQQLLSSSDLMVSSRLCDHDLLNSILCRYRRQCISMQIDFHTDIRSGSTDFISDSDLTSLFCNLLDNAIEAAGKIPESFIEVTANKQEKTPFVVITVINSCRKNPFSTQEGRLLTSKSDKHDHGFGIKSIRRTIRKYHGNMQMYYHDNSLTFHAIITLKR